MKKFTSSFHHDKFIWTLAIAALLGARPAHAQSLTDIGSFTGKYSYAAAINSSGEVAGGSTSSNGTSRAYLYSDGTLSNLGTLGYGGATDYSAGAAINDLGQVVGGAAGPNGGEYSFLYSGGVMSSIGNTNVNSSADGINNSGQVVGTSTNSKGNYAYLYSDGTMTNLGTLSTNPNLYFSAATAINNSGEVVGFSLNNSGHDTAFIYANGTMSSLDPSGSEPYSLANAINDVGQVAGVVEASNGDNTAVVFSGGQILRLGTLSSVPGYRDSNALDLNDAGTVVGFSDNDTGALEAFIYTKTSGMENLNTVYSSLLVSGTGAQTGFTSLTQATGINDAGQIAGNGEYWNGSTLTQQAFLLNPAEAPEPSTWALLLGGMAALAFWRKRRTKMPLAAPSASRDI